MRLGLSCGSTPLWPPEATWQPGLSDYTCVLLRDASIHEQAAGLNDPEVIAPTIAVCLSPVSLPLMVKPGMLRALGAKL
jgi:hypothetical protein